MDPSGYGANFKRSYSPPTSLGPTPTVSAYTTDENGVAVSAWYPGYSGRPHASSFSTASTSSSQAQPSFQRSYSDSEWAPMRRAITESSAEYLNGVYYAPSSLPYTSNPYYPQHPVYGSYATHISAYASSTYPNTSLAPISTITIPQQAQGFLSPLSASSPLSVSSPLSATSPVAPSYSYRRGSEVSVSPPSEDFPHEHRNKSNRQHGCSQCDKSFRRKADLMRHDNCVHDKDNAAKYFCDARVCDRNRQGSNGGFTRKDHLVEHLRNFHHREIPKRTKYRGVEREPPMSSADTTANYSNDLQANDIGAYADSYRGYTPEPDTYQTGESETPGNDQQAYAEGEG